jgi:hypothetical protein
MNGERYLLVALVLVCLLPLAAALPVFAEPQAEPAPTLPPQPELPSGAGYIVTLDAVLAHLSATHGSAAPAPGIRWTVEPLAGDALDGAGGYCYLAESWRICVTARADNQSPRVYHVHLEHPPTGLEWIGRVDEFGQLF